MASDNIEIGISLDNVDALAKTLDLSKALDSIGDHVGIDNLALKFGKLHIAVSIAQKAIAAMNKAIEFAVEGENIKAIEGAYNNLAYSMGVSGDKMLEGMRRVSKGTIDETDLMQLASKAMIQFGNQSAKIPEVFAVARGAAKLFGGTAEEQFEKITQAIARQRTGQLASIGIHINADKVMRQYADSIGKAADSLTDAEKRAAILNETLKQGAVNMEAAGKSSKPIQESYKQMNVAIQDLKESIAKISNALISDKVAAFFANKASSIKSWKDSVIAMFGEGTEQVEAKSRKLNEQLIEQTNRLNEHLKKAETMSHPSDVRWAEKVTRQLTYTIEQTRQQIEALENRAKEITKEESDAAAPQRAAQAKAIAARMTEEQLEEQRKQLKNFIDFETARIGVAQQSLDSRLAIETDLDKAESIIFEQKAIRNQQFNLMVKQLDQNTALSSDQKNEIIKKSAIKLNDDLIKLERDKDAVSKTLLQNQTKGNQDFFTNLKASAKQAYGEIILENQNAVTTMKTMMQTGIQGLSGAFTMLGELAGGAMMGIAMTTEEAAKKMLGYMLGVIGDIAIQFGTLLILQAFEFPWKAAIGAALLTFGGVMKGLSGGLSKTSGSAPSISGGGTGSGTSFNAAAYKDREDDKKNREEERRADKEQRDKERAEAAALKEEERRREQAEKDRLMAAREMERYQQTTGRSVSVHIQGNYFETEQTKTRLMDIIRQASDSQDFNLVSVGG
jgi:hypothetical protein